MKTVAELKNIQSGRDFWVIGSGPSMNHIDPEFFINKMTIGINWVFKWFPVDWVVAKEQYVARGALAHRKRNGAGVIYPKYSAGNRAIGEPEVIEHTDAFRFDHPHNQLTHVELNPIGVETEFNPEGVLVVSYSTITTALHLAAFMGAKNIVVCGHDCGTLDGDMNFAEYPESPIGDGAGFYRGFIRDIEPQTVLVRQALTETYGVRIYSLNPFLNFGLEGHHYER